jgi:hypothetical protein
MYIHMSISIGDSLSLDEIKLDVEVALFNMVGADGWAEEDYVTVRYVSIQKYAFTVTYIFIYTFIFIYNFKSVHFFAFVFDYLHSIF